MADYIHATGRRKRATARVRLFTSGDGSIQVNGRPMEEYFPVQTWQSRALRPLMLVKKHKEVTIQSALDGGGGSAQAGALAHGISRALMKLDPELRGILKKDGQITRDPREKERKKYGQPGARKRFQYSKR